MTAQPDTMETLRHQIDRIDDALVALLAERLGIVQRVVAVKRREGLPALIPDRVEAVVAHVRARAEVAGAPPDLAEAVWRRLIDWTIAFEDSHLG